jgi:hypothetical protein
VTVASPYARPHRSLAERFWEKVAKGDGCWLWTASKDRSGYGQIGVKTEKGFRPVKAHRIAWQLTHGAVAPGQHVLHQCDTPSCVRPDHLFVGTHADNMQDMLRKGRQGHSERHGMAKLTNADVVAIRASSRSSADLSAVFGVGEDHISRIRRGVVWKGVRP